MKKLLLFLLVLSSFSGAKVTDAEIANIFILGFYGDEKAVYNDICKRGLGGVIVFDKSPVKKGAYKNFKSADDLKRLTTALKSCGTRPLIAIDQEGGLVQRVRFKRYPSAKDITERGGSFAKSTYQQMAKELHQLGINLNFAPVVDLALNPKNRVIVKFKRSYGDLNSVLRYASIFIDAMHKYNIATTLKHFPGHGSSAGDTHKGFVDVTTQRESIELLPFKKLGRYSDAIMLAHLFDKKIDPYLPISLSKRAVRLIRDKLKFKGVIITDDMQMGGVAKLYSLKDRIKYSINAGADIILFANQVHPRKVLNLNRAIKIVRELLNSGEVKESSIKRANRNINSLKERLYR
jgi:beta-N-acetylhexosaminidase